MIAQWLEQMTDDRKVPVRIAQAPLQNFGNSVYPLCQCHSEQLLKAVGPFYMVSTPGEVNNPAHADKCVTCCRGVHILEKDNSKINRSCVSP